MFAETSLAPALPDRLRQIGAEIAKKRKRLRRVPLLSHEQHGNLRQQQVNRRHRAHRLRATWRAQPVANRPVADLIVILDERDERVGGKCAALSRRRAGHTRTKPSASARPSFFVSPRYAP